MGRVVYIVCHCNSVKRASSVLPSPLQSSGKHWCLCCVCARALFSLSSSTSSYSVWSATTMSGRFTRVGDPRSQQTREIVFICMYICSPSVDHFHITSSTSQCAGNGDIRCSLRSWVSLDRIFPGSAQPSFISDVSFCLLVHLIFCVCLFSPVELLVAWHWKGAYRMWNRDSVICGDSNKQLHVVSFFITNLVWILLYLNRFRSIYQR